MDATGTTVLSPEECLARLRSATWGRVAISMQTIAMVIPVPVLVVDDRLGFTTTPGSAFDRAVQAQPISVQVEGQEVGPDAGDVIWSVVVSGVCAPAEGFPTSRGSDPAALESAGTDHVRWNAVPFSLLQGWRAPMPVTMPRTGSDGKPGANHRTG